MKKLDIIFDSDDVLADTNSEALSIYNTEYNDNLNVTDIKSWNLSDYTKPGSDIEKIFKQEKFFRNLKPVRGSVEIVNLLASEGHNLYVATSSPFEGYRDKGLWLQETYPQIPKGRIAMLDCKYLLDADIILDDALHNLSPTKCKFPIIFDQPWNRTGAEGLIRAYDWFDFYDEIIQRIKIGYSYKELLDFRELPF